ncbi:MULTISPECIES: DUF72 domain-containing protein [unclassified Chelatococcus]|uniref:DUF72 domain-containing protein n=1 Tax=unclassified Chelatococcus TaxID=2638111 RepID=UPI001BCC2BFB|nr:MULTISPECIES: DUF72 domain-containing protein [unclassified Chelatococcus]CAH1653902.1 DUF72 domain-containing protein [Hyphomicrobiales bacterium]MBS7742848.1 DUF72 domain-containing protein [Chelatococcus sp. HY11]MBX3542034.1 DUF72 domain-containing protein [Chelatococcus sp.]MCO5074074.1 DUF72 domain-containing protein [Chelatococcus sp.]CAH1694682.1 DUF72 domain-containing protein [Hyphomicrobiales bacterium]
MGAHRGDIHVGVSGWTYAPWRGTFYPKGLTQRRELAFAASQFPALEINGTFYGLQRLDTFQRWAEATPDHFVFTLKGSRYITHTKRLKDLGAALANFFASGLLCLGPKLGPLLWQLPPNFQFDAGVIDDFLARLPKDTGMAAQLAGHHDDRVEERAAATSTDARRPLRHALEIRHDSFRTPRFINLLRRHSVALVCADTVKWPRLMDLTSDFVYCRLHGSSELYRSRYSDDDLDRWAARIAAWAHGQPMEDGDFAGAVTTSNKPRDVFVFFDNTDKLHAPKDARRLMDRLSLHWGAGKANKAA